MTPNPVDNERGMVLLLVLVIVALLSALVIEFSYSTLIDLRLTETHRDSTQAYYLAKGGVNFGIKMLADNIPGNSREYDARSELWGQGLTNYPLEEGASISIEIEDLDGRLACNQLVNRQDDNPVTVIYDQLQRLFVNVLDLAEPDAEELVMNLRDWLDKNDRDNAESSYYLSLQLPYRAKNGPLDTLDELAMVKGFDADMVTKLEPHLTAFGSAGTNINTASVEVIMALHNDIERADAELIVAHRTDAPFENITDLAAVLGQTQTYAALSSLAGNTLAPLTVKSDHYRIRSAARVNEGTRRLEALVAKSTNSVHQLRIR